MDVPGANAIIGSVARAVTLPIQAINPLVAGDGVITLPLAVMPEPVRKPNASDHHTRPGADSGAAGRAAAFAAAANPAAVAAGRSSAHATPASPPVVEPDTSSVSARSRGFNLYA